MKTIIRTLLLIGAVTYHLGLFAQNRYTVFDKATMEGVPFAKITTSQYKPQLTDIDGIFILPDSLTSGEIKITAFGYRDSIVSLELIADNQILLTPLFQEIQEMVVQAGENPAHRIIQAAIDRRKMNDPLKNNAFYYESYSKFIFDINREAYDTARLDMTDTNVYDAMRFFDQQHLFLVESASRRTFLPPSKDKEEIIAYKVSGFKNPIFSTFANEMQSFSFYDEAIKILGKEYVSPIAPGATRRYFFQLEDTVVNASDTTFTIYYRPRKGKDFIGLEGYLYINTNGFAIEKVIASPYDQKDMEVQIIQEYAIVENTKWFPSKLSTRLDMKNFQLISALPGSFLQGKGNTYLRSIDIDPENIKKRTFNNVTVSTAEDAGEKKAEEWNELRKYELTERELRTYEMVDSLSEAENLEQKFDLFTSAMSGKVPLGKKINLDVARVLNYNQYEKFRLGLGLETSNRLMKFATVGGYGAYGFKDKAFKYGGFTTFHINKKNGIDLKLSFADDITERGGMEFLNDGFSLNSPSLLRQFYIEQFDKQRKAEVSLSWNILANIRLNVSGNYQRIAQTNSYEFIRENEPVNAFDQAEVGIDLSWNIRERVMMLGNTRVSKGTKWPKIQVKLAKGLTGIERSTFDYLRSSVSINQEVVLRAFGKFHWKLEGDQTLGDVPLLYAHRGNGTGKYLSISVSESFQTMEPSRFYHTRQIAFYTRLDLQAFKTKAKWNEPSLSLQHAIGFGEFKGKENHTYVFQSADKGYYEGGMVVNGLLVSGFAQFGVGVFYRYGTYADTDWKKNIFPKFSVGIAM